MLTVLYQSFWTQSNAIHWDKNLLGRNEVAGESYCWPRRAPKGGTRPGCGPPRGARRRSGDQQHPLGVTVSFSRVFSSQGQVWEAGSRGNPGGLVEATRPLRCGLGRGQREKRESSPIGSCTGKAVFLKMVSKAQNETTTCPHHLGPWTPSLERAACLIPFLLFFLCYSF